MYKVTLAIFLLLIMTSFNFSRVNVSGVKASGSDTVFTSSALIVASNAPQVVKDAANEAHLVYGDLVAVVDGVNDQVEINAAINAASPGRVVLSAGTFNIAAPIQLLDGTVLEGQGLGGATDPATVAGTTILSGSGGISVINATNKDYFVVRNLKVYRGLVGLNINTTAGAGIHKDFVLENLTFNGQLSPGSVGLLIKGAGSSDLLTTWRATNINVRRVHGTGIHVEHATDFFGVNWYSLGTAGHGILIRDSASFNATNIRGDWAGPGAGGNFSGLRFISITHATFTNIAAHNNNGAGLYISTGGTDIQVIGGWIRGSGRDTNLQPYERGGIIVAATTEYVTIQGVHSYNEEGQITQQYGIVDIGPTHTLIGNTFHDNEISSVRNVDPAAIVIGNRGI